MADAVTLEAEVNRVAEKADAEYNQQIAVNAAASAVSAQVAQSTSTASAAVSTQKAAEAAASAASAAAVVTGGTASLTPSAGKIPLADANGFIDPRWIRLAVNDIGRVGTQGFGIGICPALPAGFTPMAGTSDPTTDNYGNYTYSDGSVMVWVPAFFYKYGDGTNGLAANLVDIKPESAYASAAHAVAEGYALHRAFYDGGVVQRGVMVDKYQVSNNAGTASSLKNGNPLSSNAAHNPFSGLTGAPSNIYASAFAACKTRGASFFPSSRFIYSALALLALAHANASTATTYCAWYQVGANFPKGNNNNALHDASDVTVVYTTDGYPNCGQTGSGLPFAKTTHNGQNSGIADLNGNIWEITPGLNCIGVSKTITAATQASPCKITSVGHGLVTGAVVEIFNIVGMVELNGKLFTATVVDADNFTLDGVNSTAFAAYTSGGTSRYGTLYALKTSVAMKNVTSGNTLSTDHWGATGVAAQFDAITFPFLTTYPNNANYERFGSGSNPVLSAATSGTEWAKAGAGLPVAGGWGASGTTQFGQDQLYQALVNELCPISGSSWSDYSGAGVWSLNLYYTRGTSANYVGCRAALYL
jgi:hypothetical protein